MRRGSYVLFPCLTSYWHGGSDRRLYLLHAVEEVEDAIKMAEP